MNNSWGDLVQGKWLAVSDFDKNLYNMQQASQLYSWFTENKLRVNKISIMLRFMLGSQIEGGGRISFLDLVAAALRKEMTRLWVLPLPCTSFINFSIKL